jgi:hypothetical protein
MILPPLVFPGYLQSRNPNFHVAMVGDGLGDGDVDGVVGFGARVTSASMRRLRRQRKLQHRTEAQRTGPFGSWQGHKTFSFLRYCRRGGTS